MATRWGRFARGWLAALFSTLVAAVSHTLAGGDGPSGLALVLALAFAGLTCIALTGKSVSLVRVAASVALSQVSFHTLFSTIGGSTAGTGMVGGAGHEHAASVVLIADGGTAMHHTDGWMWLGHGVAAVLTVIALRYGEGAFWQLRSIARLFSRTVFAVVPVVSALPRTAPRLPAVGHFFVPRFCAFVRSSLGLRGPPVGAAA
ncbi:hypothetical protein HD599_001886 [Conyzicola lurida]|uniref:Uncharacterized protein n=1 Tax=Conyzicola lurida TaxID=1172621 RepID=A0A841APP5_9MICO|nr:hypothetical protein [Conyzicola lurida]MBB5843563.1 hypothetical protein [Conyzicola lurida]